MCAHMSVSASAFRHYPKKKSHLFLFVCLFALSPIKAPFGRSVMFHFCLAESFLLPRVQDLFWHQRAVKTTYKWAGGEPWTVHLPARTSSGGVSETHPPPHTHTTQCNWPISSSCSWNSNRDKKQIARVAWAHQHYNSGQNPCNSPNGGVFK